MDEKHDMLYPALNPTNSTLIRDQRATASAAIGLPSEGPPSYDMAMSSAGPSGATSSTSAASGGWTPSAPAASPEIAVLRTPQPQPRSFLTRPTTIADTVIVAQPAVPQHQPTVPTQPSNVTGIPAKLGPNPCAVTCPACGSCKTTRMCYTPNTRTHLSALLLCLVGWCCCACCVPYCMNSCRTGNHYCAKCNTFLGAFNPREDK